MHAIGELKNDDFKTPDFSLLIERVLAGVYYHGNFQTQDFTPLIKRALADGMPIPLVFTLADFRAFLRPCYLMSEKDRTQSKVFKLI